MSTEEWNKICIAISVHMSENFINVQFTREILTLVLYFSFRLFYLYGLNWASLVAQMVKNPPAMQETQVQSLGWENPLEKGMAIHSSILAWRIPWTEESGRLQSMGSQRVRHD